MQDKQLGFNVLVISRYEISLKMGRLWSYFAYIRSFSFEEMQEGKQAYLQGRIVRYFDMKPINHIRTRGIIGIREQINK